MKRRRRIQRSKYSDVEYKEYSEKFVRWQKYTIDRLAFTNNLILTIAIGILGYVFSREGFCCDFLLRSGSLLLFVSLTFGLLMTISRLVDFRITKEITRIRKRNRKEEIEKGIIKNDESNIQGSLSDLRNQSRFLGELTWILFLIQVVFFFLGSSIIFYSFF